MNDRLHRCYAGWLAKLAGIRLGAPIEGWTYDRIREEVGEIDGYLTDLTRFAADDDSNGPMIFIRAMSDYSLDPTAEEIGKTWLNYTPWEHGMFWWGGYGRSTEHTAYLNLANGIPAPRSGSIAQNGSTVAEQIGGQIFIDTWGLVCPGDPAKAAELAWRAASVSHDGNGAYGGQFVAAAVAIAYDERNIETIIREALKYIPEDCEYARAVRSVAIFHAECPDDWRECFEYVRANWGYDRYPGTCHIIPNAAVMALAMYYGQGDFDKTLNIACMCGWDTDCNVGNVATILGVMNGLDGIDYDKWLRPINDGFAASCVLGCLNYLDAPWCARYLDDLARRLAGEETDGFEEFARVYDFALPRSTHSFESETATLSNPGGCLKCVSDAPAEVFRRTYHAPDYFMDDRYSPEFTPDIYPGQTVCAKVKGSGVCVRLFAYDMIGNRRVDGEKITLNGEAELALTIPPMDSACIERVGLAWDGGELILDELRLEGDPDYTLQPALLPREVHEVEGVNQFTRFKGICERLSDGMAISCADVGAVYTGDLAWKDYALDANVVPVNGGDCELLVRVEGALRYVAVRLSKGALAIVRADSESELLAAKEYAFEAGKPLSLRVECRGNTVTVLDETGELLKAECPCDHGAVGFGVRSGGRMKILSYGVHPL